MGLGERSACQPAALSNHALSALNRTPMRRGLSFRIAISPRAEQRLSAAWTYASFGRSLVYSYDAVFHRVENGLGSLMHRLLVLSVAN